MQRYMRGYLEGERFFLSERERSSQYFADLLRTKDRDMIELAYDHPQHQMGRKPYPDMNAVKSDPRYYGRARTGGEEIKNRGAV